MSHFFVAVIMPKEVQMEDYETKIAQMLEPFDENMDVEPYEEDCCCVGAKARNEVHDEVWGDVQGLRDEFNLKYKEHENRGEIWKTQVWSPRDRKVKELLSQREDKDEPDSSCEECKGAGKVMSTYNPNSKWDWYRIGGRWDGDIQGNKTRSSDGGFNFDPKHEQLRNNVVQVAFILEQEIMPFAFLLPDGQWIEKGKMGWWGMVTDEKDCDLQKKEFLDIMTKYEDHFVVTLDCHI